MKIVAFIHCLLQHVLLILINQVLSESFHSTFLERFQPPALTGKLLKIEPKSWAYLNICPLKMFKYTNVDQHNFFIFYIYSLADTPNIVHQILMFFNKKPGSPFCKAVSVYKSKTSYTGLITVVK